MRGKNILSIIVLSDVTNSGGSQVPVLGRGHQLGRGAGGVRAVRRLAGQHRRGEGAQLSAGVWTLQGRAGGQVVLDWGYVWMEIIGSIEGATDKNSANV